MALLGGRRSGFSDADLQKAWLKEWGEDAIVVPAAIVAALAIAWLGYRSGFSGTTLGEAFDVEGGPQGSQPARNTQRTTDRDRRRANEIAIAYLNAAWNGRPISMNETIGIVAEREAASFDTIKAAHKYGPEIRDRLADLGITLSG